MKRAASIRALKRLEPELRARGASSVSLFGSTARNAAKATSDIDLFYTVGAKGFSLIEVASLSWLLRRELKVPVDAFPLSCLKPAVRAAALSEAVRIY